MTVLLRDFNAKLEREDIFKLTIGNESLHQDSTDYVLRTVNCATSRKLIVQSMMFLQQNIPKYIWTSPDGKTHNQTDHILMDKRWHLSILGV